MRSAAHASVGHVVHVSIAGLERTARLPYSRVKLRAITSGNTSASGHRGMTTWSQWLARDEVAPAARIAA
jgi:hypothetical protein